MTDVGDFDPVGLARPDWPVWSAPAGRHIVAIRAGMALFGRSPKPLTTSARWRNQQEAFAYAASDALRAW